MFPITCIFIQNTSTFNIQNIRPVKIAPLKSPDRARNGIFGATFFLGWENYSKDHLVNYNLETRWILNKNASDWFSTAMPMIKIAFSQHRFDSFC